MIRSLPQRTVILVALACVSLLGLEGWREWLAYGQQLHETKTSLTNLASSLTQHAEDTMELADTALLGVVERLEVDGVSPAALTRLGGVLRARVQATPRIRDFIVFGEDGSWLATSMPALGTNDGDRAYFQHHRDDPARTPFIGPPIRSRSSGRWTITVSRRFQHPDGSFAGVAMALIDMDYFARLYATYDLGPDHSIALLSTSGTLLVRDPPNEAFIGSDFSNTTAFTKLRESPIGSYEVRAVTDGVTRISGYRRSERYPLLMWVGMSKYRAMASWKADARVHLAIAAVLSGVVALLGLHLTRQMSRRLAAEEQVRESEARYRLLAENSGDLIALKPAFDGARAYVSPASRTMIGYEPHEFASMPISFFLHPDELEGVSADLSSMSITNSRVTSVHRLRHKAGHWLWVEPVFQLVNPGTSQESIVVTARDVTQRRALEAERAVRECQLEMSNAELGRVARHLATARDAADQASRAKSRFLAGMSHELRTPLHGILGYAQLLRVEGRLDEVQAARVDAMLGAGTHLLTMINGVLDLSRIEAERLELQTTEIDLRSVAAACLDLVRPAAQAKALTVALCVAPDVPARATADLTRLRQVLLNLLGNAVKFTMAGRIELRLAVSAAHLGRVAGPRLDPDPRLNLRIEVADTGRGVSAQRRPRLFQEFERLDARSTSDIEGAGLGLALSARLAALMGGCLGHEDNGGGGSVFWLELPLVVDPPAALIVDQPVALIVGQPAALIIDHPVPAPGVAAPEPSGEARALRVMVVDDVAMNRDIASAFLRTGGHEVLCVGSGREAVEAASAGDFDVVLMDVRMPEMDGLEATRRIRSLAGARARVPIVAVTAQAFAEQVEACREAGMDDHLAKPFAPAALLATALRAAANGHAGNHAIPQAAHAGPAPSGNVVFEQAAARLDPEGTASCQRIIAARGEAVEHGCLSNGAGVPALARTLEIAVEATLRTIASHAPAAM